MIFNASHWRLLSVKAGRDADEAILHINSTEADRGRIGVALAMPVGKAIARGERELVVCEFAPIVSRKGLPLMFDFGDFPVRREMADAEANLLTANYSIEGSELDSLQVVPESSDQGFTPGQPISIFGTNLASGIESATGSESLTVIDISGNQRLAPMLYVSPNRINCRIPHGTIEGTATLIITNSNGDSFRTLVEIAKRR